ncbi:MAG: anthranilate synthase component I [bacterium]
MLNKFSPSYGKYKKDLAKHGLACVYKDISCDMDTPVSLFMKISNAENAFLLESAEGGIRWGRYSFISASSKFVLKGFKDYFEINGKRRRTKDAFGELKKFLKKFSFPPMTDGPPFIGGAVGYFSYDIVNEWENIGGAGKGAQDFPYFYFVLPEVIIVVDHLKKLMRIICWGYAVGERNAKNLFSSSLSKIDETLNVIRQPVLPPQTKTGGNLNFRSNVSKTQFENMVRKAKSYIINGDCIQTVISRKWDIEIKRDPVFIYRALRMINPSPYMYYLKFGGAHIIGSSPEILVKKTGASAVIRPIAGTRPRGKDAREDKAFCGELLKDVKERAEHTMLVDLARNDLGKVSKFGSVSVKELMVVEKFSHVIHLTSEVEGTLEESEDSFSLFKASFPAGTVSGAPKVRAMQIIGELERDARGPYAGAVGYFSFNGDMDFAITIRTIVATLTKAQIQAGAGIVYDSVPEKEYFETENKAKALMKAIELARTL